MKFLVEANVLSEPTKHAPDVYVVEWLLRHERELAVNPIIHLIMYKIMNKPIARKLA